MADDEQTPLKPTRTPAQMAALEKARAKAYETRRRNAEERAKQRAVDERLKAEFVAEKKAKLDAQYEALGCGT